MTRSNRRPSPRWRGFAPQTVRHRGHLLAAVRPGGLAILRRLAGTKLMIQAVPPPTQAVASRAELGREKLEKWPNS
jgi:hypothetical protein